MYLRIRAGLLDPKHVAAMEHAVWLYLYLHANVRFSGEGAGTWHGKEPYRHDAAAGALGVSVRQVKRWFDTLRQGGYVTATRLQRGLRVELCKYGCDGRSDTDGTSAATRSDTDGTSEVPSVSLQTTIHVTSERPPTRSVREKLDTRDSSRDIHSLLTEREAPAPRDAPRPAPKPNKSGELIDLLRAEGVPFDLTPQDHRNLRLSALRAAQVAEVYCAIARQEFGDEWLQDHLSVSQAIKAWPGYQNRKTRGPRLPPPQKRSESGVAGQMNYLREQGLVDEFGNWLSSPEPPAPRGAAAGAYPAAGLGGGVGEARYGVPLQLPQRRGAAG